MSDIQPERPVLPKGAVAMCDLIDTSKRPTGDQIEVTIVDVRLNGGTPQSYRVYCKTERGTDKYIWVQAQFIHEKVIEPISIEPDPIEPDPIEPDPIEPAST